MFLAEAESGKATARSLAVLYALFLAAEEQIDSSDWRRINDAVNAALCLDTARKINRFRTVAAEIDEATALRQMTMNGVAAAGAHPAPARVQ
jgi:CHASE1-domain containing sensor protein